MELASGTARDIEVTRAVREAYPDARLLVDANNGWTPEQTVDFLTQVADCQLYWIEEPSTRRSTACGCCGTTCASRAAAR